MGPVRQQGVTLIELMIVVVIVGIIASMAIPMYLNYTARAMASEGIALFSPAKNAVTEYYTSQGLFPDSNSKAGLDAPTAYRGSHVASVTVGNSGVVTVLFDEPALQNGTFVFTPTEVSNGPLQWTCSTSIPLNLVPKTCRP